MSTTPTALDALLARMTELGLDGQLDAELKALHDELRTTVAQLETANQDLEAATADLESVGRELERAATELSAVQEELGQRSDDIERITGYLQSVIDGTPGAVVVVDVDQKVRAWSKGAAARWGASASDVSGKAFGRLDLKGETPDLIALVRSVIAGEDGTGEGGLHAHPLKGAGGAVDGAVLFVPD